MERGKKEQGAEEEVVCSKADLRLTTIHSPCSETTPASAGSSSDLRCCGLACLRRDMLLASGLAMRLLLRSDMSLRFADASAKSDWNQRATTTNKQTKKKSFAHKSGWRAAGGGKIKKKK